ncbi:hypothetical protein G6015_01410, partial [Dietzia sp. SLG510A3-40A3]|nr:hypothetical protein [Dietzia sp. SLG510A3-40A3]
GHRRAAPAGYPTRIDRDHGTDGRDVGERERVDDDELRDLILVDRHPGTREVLRPGARHTRRAAVRRRLLEGREPPSRVNGIGQASPDLPPPGQIPNTVRRM